LLAAVFGALGIITALFPFSQGKRESDECRK